MLVENTRKESSALHATSSASTDSKNSKNSKNSTFVVGLEFQTPSPEECTVTASLAVAGFKGCVAPSNGHKHLGEERCACFTKSGLTADQRSQRAAQKKRLMQRRF